MKIITALAIALTLVSCKNSEALTRLGVSIAESRGAITTRDAADIRALEAALKTSAKAPNNVHP